MRLGILGTGVVGKTIGAKLAARHALTLPEALLDKLDRRLSLRD